jgi:hypothetical protein
MLVYTRACEVSTTSQQRICDPESKTNLSTNKTGSRSSRANFSSSTNIKLISNPLFAITKLPSASMQRLRHQTQLFNVIHKRQPHRFTLACAQTSRQLSQYHPLLMAEHHFNHTLLNHNSIFLLVTPQDSPQKGQHVTQQVVQHDFSHSPLICLVSDL